MGSGQTLKFFHSLRYDQVDLGVILPARTGGNPSGDAVSMFVDDVVASLAPAPHREGRVRGTAKHGNAFQEKERTAERA